MADPHGIPTKRYEIILEGSNDGEDWKETDSSKPGKLSLASQKNFSFSRLDWQAWFLPFGIFHGKEVWFQKFSQTSRGISIGYKTFKKPPFSAEAPPSYIRAVVYDYGSTTFEEKAKQEIGGSTMLASIHQLYLYKVQSLATSVRVNGQCVAFTPKNLLPILTTVTGNQSTIMTSQKRS